MAAAAATPTAGQNEVFDLTRFNLDLKEFCDSTTVKVSSLIIPLLGQIDNFRSELDDLIHSTDTEKAKFPQRDITVSKYKELGHKWATLITKYNEINKSYCMISGTFNRKSQDIIDLTKKFNETNEVYQNRGLQHSWRGLVDSYASQSVQGGFFSSISNRLVRALTNDREITEFTLREFPLKKRETPHEDPVVLEYTKDDLQNSQTSEVSSLTSQATSERTDLEKSVGED